MVELTPQVVKSVSLTKQEGEPFLLDGNRLYFKYQERVNKGKMETRYGYVDLDARTTFTRVEFTEVPKWPKRPEVSVNLNEVAFGLWWLKYAGRSHAKGSSAEFLPTPETSDGKRSKSRNHVTLTDFYEARRETIGASNSCGVEGRPSFFWDITEELMDEARQFASQRVDELEAEVNEVWKPIRVLDAHDTAVVIGIFSFDGDKKGLVTALKSWGAEIKDSDVSVDRKFLTKYIHLAKTVEELIP